LNTNTLVRRAIERAHAGVRLCPNAEVLKLKTIALAGVEEFAHMEPIHAHEQDGAVMQRRDQRGDELGEEGREVVLGHLARRHRELAVPRIAEAGDESVDLHVVRRVGENDARLAPACQTTDQVGVASVAASDRVPAKVKDIPAFNPRRGDRLQILGRLGLDSAGARLIDRERHVDLDRIESGQLYFESETEELRKFGPQRAVVPSGILWQTIEREPERADLVGVTVMGDDHGNFVVAELLQGDVHGVTVDDDVGGVDDDRRHLPELAQKAYELVALFTIMHARVVLIGLDFLDRKVNGVKGVGVGVAHRNISNL
jgi:hypothetical protein